MSGRERERERARERERGKEKERGRERGRFSGFRFQVHPPEAPAQLEGDPENEGLPIAIGQLTRSRQVGS